MGPCKPERSLQTNLSCVSVVIWIENQNSDHCSVNKNPLNGWASGLSLLNIMKRHWHSLDRTQNPRETMREGKKFISTKTRTDKLPEHMKALLISLMFIGIPAGAAPLPMVCELTSEEVPGIKVRLSERTAVSLRGELLQNDVHLGTFQTGQSKGYGPVWWSFHDSHDAGKGISVLFKDNQHWNPHRRIPRPSETNRVLFVGFDTDLWNWSNTQRPGVFRGNRNLIKAAAGFWSISNRCLGGRMMRG